MEKRIEEEEERKRKRDISRIQFIPRGTKSVPEEHCDQNVIEIMKGVNGLIEWNYENIKQIFSDVNKTNKNLST